MLEVRMMSGPDQGHKQQGDDNLYREHGKHQGILIARLAECDKVHPLLGDPIPDAIDLVDRDQCWKQVDDCQTLRPLARKPSPVVIGYAPILLPTRR